MGTRVGSSVLGGHYCDANRQAARMSSCFLTPHRGRLERYLPVGTDYPRRQDLPPAYAINGAIYFIRPAALREHRTFFPQRTRPYVMPAERSLDVDEP